MKKVFLSVLALLTYGLCAALAQQPVANTGIRGAAQNSADTWGLEDTGSSLSLAASSDSHFSFTEGDPNSSTPLNGCDLALVNHVVCPDLTADLTSRQACALQMLTTSHAFPSASFANGTFYIALGGSGKSAA